MSTAELPRREFQVRRPRKEDGVAPLQVYARREWIGWLDRVAETSGLKRSELIGLAIGALAEKYGLPDPPARL